MREALRQISDGFVGKPLMSRGQHFYRKPPVLPAGDWRTSVASGGGCLIDTSYHEIYSVEALMGSPIRQVQALVRTLNYNIEADDISLMMFEHENCGLSTVSAAWFAPSIGHEKGPGVKCMDPSVPFASITAVLMHSSGCPEAAKRGRPFPSPDRIRM